jgi:threonylcarbamoyladenosine tRNA methylthiotransferase MtaB
MTPFNQTVAFATLGCKTNQFESAAMEERLREAGFRVIPFDEGPDLVVAKELVEKALGGR